MIRKDTDRNTPAILYMIVHKLSRRRYYGISWSTRQKFDPYKLFLNRFEKHITSAGSVHIREILKRSDKSEFEGRILCIGHLGYISDLENKLAGNSLYPVGLNGNAGRAIIHSAEGKARIAKASRDRLLNRSVEERDRAIIKFKQMALRRKYIRCGKVVWLNNGEVLPSDSPGSDDAITEARLLKERKIYGGRTKAQHDRLAYMRSDEGRAAAAGVWKETPGWRAGRTKLMKRKCNGDFTEKEKLAYSELSKKTKEYWSEKPKSYRMERTKAGLDTMNTKESCRYCGKTSNRGNIKRWHNENCKSKISQ